MLEAACVRRHTDREPQLKAGVRIPARTFPCHIIPRITHPLGAPGSPSVPRTMTVADRIGDRVTA